MSAVRKSAMAWMDETSARSLIRPNTKSNFRNTWIFWPQASLLVGYRSLRICALLAPRLRPKSRRSFWKLLLAFGLVLAEIFLDALRLSEQVGHMLVGHFDEFL